MQDENEERVLSVIRALARELGGDRAASAVSPGASLERDVGLGSLERAELLMRLEPVVGRELDDRFLLYDTPREIARALVDAPVSRGAPAVSVTETFAATAVRVDDAASLVDAMRRRAAAEPTRVHVLLHGGERVKRVTYAELWDGASRIAAGLAARGIKRGEPVAIMLPTGLDYLQSFMGVLTAGAVAVPLYPPARLDRMAEYLTRQSRILANAEARVLIAMPEAAPVARMLRDAAPALTKIVTADSLRAATPGDAVTVAPEESALIQYTSGSTGDPKGVLLSHANLLANIRAIVASIDLQATDAVVSWLPLYHDMGLIGTWLNALFHAIPLTLMSPLEFLARPERWLWAIHSQRATLSAAPNFAYELCVRKIRDEAIEGLDLSSWRVASNGSEPVSAATLDRFAKRFERYGLRREALMPVYGLAECAVALCFPPVNRAPLVDVVEREAFASERRAVSTTTNEGSALKFVSVGHALPEHEVRILDEHEHEVPERVVGRLVFRGPSCMSGYYHNQEATARVMSPDGWIDSGDLAYRSGAELFITGRVKDVIMKGGRNLVAQEVEEVVGSIDGIRKGCVAAFGVADETTGTERVVVLAESRAESASEHERLEREAIATVAAQVGVPPDVVRIVPPGTVPKTPSGKIRRAAARDAYESGPLHGRAALPLRLRLALFAGVAAERVRCVSRDAIRWFQIGYMVSAWAVALALLGPLAVVLMHVLPEGRPVRILSRILARIAIAISGCRIEVEGRERLPRDGPLVLVTNHASYADTPALIAALPVDFVFVAMREILSWRLIGTLARRGRHPTVDRWHPQQSIADAAAIEDRVRGGEIVLFFAEGGFSGVRGLKPFRLGAFETAVATGAPVVPVALRGTRRVLPADARLPRPGHMHVWIGDPIRADGSGWNAAVGLRDRAADAVAAHCGEPRLASTISPAR